ncbi:MAG: NADP-dependent malic enzyme [Verrucomicrobia bacterium]|nr:NADP-dependent malic enzyme [Verrucomicrobiota bacterium]
MIRKEDALEYHSRARKGKLEVVSSKPCLTQRDLSLAYTPGVAEPCRVIHEHPDEVYNLTTKANLVGVVSNGTAVLGLGDIGALASKPVMEGKGVLFKRFADIDVFDIELNTHDPDEVIRACELLEPTFGGINLEDIKAPECFYIEETLIKRLNIPVFHDDQHGTAIICGAALQNALELVGKKIDQVRVVFSGAGAAGIAVARFFETLGVKREHIVMSDIKGVVYQGRTDGMNKYMEHFASKTKARTLAEALEGADVFVGVSAGNLVSQDMVRSMAKDPVVFAMANPDPEITYDQVKAARSDVIAATGRSDYPNQVNNVLGFPFIFRGALDVRATAINEQMKIAASKALAALARENVSDWLGSAYGRQHFEFGRDYIIPKPFDPRVLLWVAPAVAKAAMDSGVARVTLNLDEYRDQLEARLGRDREIMRSVYRRARQHTKRIVYPEGDLEKALYAAENVIEEGIATPVLLGNRARIEAKITELRVDLPGVEIVDIETSPDRARYAEELYKLRHRRGVNRLDADKLVLNPDYYAAMMLRLDEADGVVSGLTKHYPASIRPYLEIVRTAPGIKTPAGMCAVITRGRVTFFADTTVSIDPTAEDIADIAVACADKVRTLFNIEPRIAMLSFSNFGSVRHPLTDKMRRAAELVQQLRPDLVVDGEMQADTAVDPEIVETTYPFSKLKGDANLLVFPGLSSGNIAFNLMQRLGGAAAIGPILTGMARPVHLLIIGAYEVRDIVHMTALAAVGAEMQRLADTAPTS